MKRIRKNPISVLLDHVYCAMCGQMFGVPKVDRQSEQLSTSEGPASETKCPKCGGETRVITVNKPPKADQQEL